MIAVNSMRLLVVCSQLPLISLTALLKVKIAAQPPFPGFGWQAPSVVIVTDFKVKGNSYWVRVSMSPQLTHYGEAGLSIAKGTGKLSCRFSVNPARRTPTFDCLG